MATKLADKTSAKLVLKSSLLGTGPIIGATPIPNLYINSGHGTLGWTMACGSARVLADILSGRDPSIDTAHLSVARFCPQ